MQLLLEEFVIDLEESIIFNPLQSKISWLNFPKRQRTQCLRVMYSTIQKLLIFKNYKISPIDT